MELDETNQDTETVIYETNITACVYEPTTVVSYSSLTPPQRLRVSEDTEPVQVAQARNTTTIEMHQWLVGRSDPNGQLTPDISELAVGMSDAPVSETDTGLTDPVARVETTSSMRENTSLRIKTFIDKGQANVDVNSGEALREVGLFADEYFLNHAVLNNDIDKTNTKTVTVDVLITYDAP